MKTDHKLHYENRFDGKIDDDDETASQSSMTSTTSYIHVSDDGAIKVINHTTSLRKKPIQNKAIPRRSGSASQAGCSAK